MLGGPCQGLLEYLDSLVISVAAITTVSPATAAHSLRAIACCILCRGEVHCWTKQSLSPGVQRHPGTARAASERAPASGTLPVPGDANVPGGYQAPERREECQRREGYRRDEPYQRCITHATYQVTYTPGSTVLCVACSPHIYRPTYDSICRRHTTNSSHAFPVACMLYTLWWAASAFLRLCALQKSHCAVVRLRIMH